MNYFWSRAKSYFRPAAECIGFIALPIVVDMYGLLDKYRHISYGDEGNKFHKPLNDHGEQTINLQLELCKVTLDIEEAAAQAFLKFMQDTGKIDKAKKVPTDSIIECMKNLVNDDQKSPLSPATRAYDSTDITLIEKYRSISDRLKKRLCDFSDCTVDTSDDRGESNSDLMITMLNIIHKKDSSIDSILKKSQQNVNLAENNLIFHLRGGAKANQEGLQEMIKLAWMQGLSCFVFYRAMERFWPIPSGAVSAAAKFSYFRFILAFHFGVPSLLFAMTASYSLIENYTIEKRANNTTETAVKGSNDEAGAGSSKSIVETDFFDMLLKAETVINDPVKGPYVQDSDQLYRFAALLVDSFFSEIMFRGFLLNSLMRYTHPVVAHTLCVMTAMPWARDYFRDTVTLDDNTITAFKATEAIALQLLARVSRSIVPCMAYQFYVSRNQIIRHEFQTQDDPLMLRVNSLLPLESHLKQIKDLYIKVYTTRETFGVDAAIKAAYRTGTGGASNGNKDKTDVTISAFAETVMAEFATDHYSSDGMNKKLSQQDLEDFLVALDWAAVDVPSTEGNVVSTQPVSIKTVFPLRSIVDPIDSAFFLSLLNLKGLLFFNSTFDPVVKKKNDDYFDYNSPEFLTNQLRLHLRRIMLRVMYPNGVTLKELESLLSITNVCTSAGVLSYIVTPLADLVSSPHLNTRLVYAEELDDDAFMDLMQERYAFLNREMDILGPKVLEVFVHKFSEELAGRQPSPAEIKFLMEKYSKYLKRVRQLLDGSFLQTRGLTKRRFLLLQNKHFSKCAEAKQLAKEWKSYFAMKRGKDLESILKLEWE